MATDGSQLGELEGAVLDALWDAGELATPAVHEKVGLPRKLAYTTILTVLQRLNKKGLAGRREEGRAHVYFAALSREEFARKRGEGLAMALSALGEAGMAAFLAEAERVDPAVFEVLRAKLRAQL
jgi:predicted transcriptional regulator